MSWVNLFWGWPMPPLSAYAIHLMMGRRSYQGFLAAWGGGALCPLAGGMIDQAWLAVLGAMVNLAIVAWLWNRRKRRQRAPKLAGYKARAALAKLAQRAREAARPRPVLRPVPGGAR